MTPELLKQAREALEECKNALSHGFDGRTGQPVFKSVAAMLAHISASTAAVALDAHASLSDYDKAIHALAPYLPDGWVAQDEDGYMSHNSVTPSPCQHGGGDWKTPARVNAVSYRLSCLRIPRCPDWRSSLRRITHNSDGTVTVERG